MRTVGELVGQMRDGAREVLSLAFFYFAAIAAERLFVSRVAICRCARSTTVRASAWRSIPSSAMRSWSWSRRVRTEAAVVPLKN